MQPENKPTTLDLPTDLLDHIKHDAQARGITEEELIVEILKAKFAPGTA